VLAARLTEHRSAGARQKAPRDFECAACFVARRHRDTKLFCEASKREDAFKPEGDRSVSFKKGRKPT
jgi:hypothetical protein